MDTAVISAKYEFTEEELNNMGRFLAESEVTLTHLREELDKIKKGYKDRIEPVERDIATLSRQITDGYTYRDYKCRIYRNRETKQVEYRDERTETIVKVEPFTVEDMQQEFPI